MILASKSPRRYELLKKLGYEFEVVSKDVDENIGISDPIKLVEELSLKKGMAVYRENEIIISSDTVVCLDNVIYGKPKDFNDAFETLKKLSGRVHQVISGICVIHNDEVTVSHDITNVFFKNLTDEEIISYINTGEPYDKAGSYAIQGIGKKFIEMIEGSKNNVIGLPTELLTKILEKYTYKNNEKIKKK